MGRKSKAQRRHHELGDLQIAILRVLWERGEATVTDVHQALLGERGLAPTTIATMLTKLEQKGVVDHRTEGRRFVYRALVEQSQVHDSMVSQLVQRLFQGDSKALMSHLLADDNIDAKELQRIKKLIAEREKEMRRGRR